MQKPERGHSQYSVRQGGGGYETVECWERRIGTAKGEKARKEGTCGIIVFLEVAHWREPETLGLACSEKVMGASWSSLQWGPREFIDVFVIQEVGYPYHI